MREEDFQALQRRVEKLEEAVAGMGNFLRRKLHLWEKLNRKPDADGLLDLFDSLARVIEMNMIED